MFQLVDKTRLNFFDKDNIYELSSILKNIDIRNQDFSVTIKDCKPGDIVYIDPPYDKINKNSFVEYNTKKV